MKKIKLLICIFLSIQGFAQTFTSFDLVSHGCSFVSPPPANTLTFNFKGDTLNIKIVEWGHCCAQPYTALQLTADTIKFTIQDTASSICTCDCPYEFNYSLYGFSGSLYVAQAFGKTYIIDRTTNSIPVQTQKPAFEKRGNILKIHSLNKDFKINIYDLKGSLKYSLTYDIIDLELLNLKTGIYLFQVMLKGDQVTEKIYLE